MKAFFKIAAIAFFLAFGTVANAAGTAQVRPSCFEGDRLIRAALRDGLSVGAEAQSARPGMSGAQMYMMYDPSDGAWGIIASVRDAEGARQCNLGVGTHWVPTPMKEAGIVQGTEPVNKSGKLCRPLSTLLEKLEEGSGEVEIGRGDLGADWGLVRTMSDDGNWSDLLVDRRAGAFEVACFSNWGSGMRLKKLMRAK